jgi:indole-3-pyruvate monooxygenase
MDAPVIIIGAGPGGLAVAACLQREGIAEALILDEADRVASSWHRHYERLHLHTPRDHSALPHLPMPSAFSRYPARAQVIEYFENYARHFALNPRLGERVDSARRQDGAWQVTTAKGRYHAPVLVVAAGYNREPLIPTWPGVTEFGGRILHSSAYVNGRPYAGKDVLVVGFGNSGGEIAIDLHEHGARPTIAVRSAVNVIPREILGVPVLALGLVQRLLSPEIADRLNAPLLKASIGDLQPYGLRKLPYGPATQIRKHGRIPLIDVGTVALLKRGAITARPGVRSFQRGAVVFDDGSRTRFDAVILATGYRPRVDAFLSAGLDAVDSNGAPTSSGRESAAAGLYFCGYHVSPNGMLREMALEARRIASAIKQG